MAARMAGRFARRAFNAAPLLRPAARPQPPPSFGSGPRSHRDLVGRLHSSGLRREIVSMMPMHTATAKAWLVSRISEVPGDAGIYLKLLWLRLKSRRS